MVVCQWQCAEIQAFCVQEQEMLKQASFMLRKSSLRVLVHVVQYFTREDSVTYRVVHSTRTLRGAAAERGGADLLLLRREPGNTKVYVKIPPIIPLLWRAPKSCSGPGGRLHDLLRQSFGAIAVVLPW